MYSFPDPIVNLPDLDTTTLANPLLPGTELLGMGLDLKLGLDMDALRRPLMRLRKVEPIVMPEKDGVRRLMSRGVKPCFDLVPVFTLPQSPHSVCVFFMSCVPSSAFFWCTVQDVRCAHVATGAPHVQGGHGHQGFQLRAGIVYGFGGECRARV